MRVPEEPESFVKLPSPPEGAEWAPPAKVIDRLVYRRDGAGFVRGGAELFEASVVVWGLVVGRG